MCFSKFITYVTLYVTYMFNYRSQFDMSDKFQYLRKVEKLDHDINNIHEDALTHDISITTCVSKKENSEFSKRSVWQSLKTQDFFGCKLQQKKCRVQTCYKVVNFTNFFLACTKQKYEILWCRKDSVVNSKLEAETVFRPLQDCGFQGYHAIIHHDVYHFI